MSKQLMRVLTSEELVEIGTKIFKACGAPASEAELVARELVEASLMGLDSHGIVRFVQYAGDALTGKIRPGEPVQIVKETPTTAIVDCGMNFGPVGACFISSLAARKAIQHGVSCVVSQNSHHVSRLGAYVQKVAERGLFALATCNSSKHGHWVVPWGGREGRLATNPLAFAAPTSHWPVVLDMSTSMISEGKVRVLMNQGLPIPEGSVLDAAGRPTTNPKDFYGPPRGTILPLGSELGYKGFGLGLLVEILSGLLAGMAASVDHPYINGLALIAIDPDAFCGATRFRALMDDLCEYMVTTPPAEGHDSVRMPGWRDFQTREERLREGIPVDEETWNQIRALMKKLRIPAEEPVGALAGKSAVVTVSTCK